MEKGSPPWRTEDSKALYMVEEWGLGYFGINDKGNVVFHPGRHPASSIDIKDVVDDVISRGVKLPVLLRFQDILRDRVVEHHRGFQKAIEEHNYKGRFLGVYPIKVNQLREVVEEILDTDESHPMGLEAGSKGELIAVLAMNSPGCLAIVNGYKDEHTMRLACLGWKLGKQLIVVIEKLSELGLLLDESDADPLGGRRLAEMVGVDPGHDPKQAGLPRPVGTQHADLGPGQEGEPDVAQDDLVGWMHLADGLHGEDELVGHKRLLCVKRATDIKQEDILEIRACRKACEREYR